MESNTKQIPCKVGYKNDIRRFSVTTSTEFSSLKNQVSRIFDISEEFVLKYLDDENEYITIESQDEYLIALELCKILRLTIEKKTPDTLHNTPKIIIEKEPASPLSGDTDSSSHPSQDIPVIQPIPMESLELPIVRIEEEPGLCGTPVITSVDTETKSIAIPQEIEPLAITLLSNSSDQEFDHIPKTPLSDSMEQEITDSSSDEDESDPVVTAVVPPPISSPRPVSRRHGHYNRQFSAQPEISGAEKKKIQLERKLEKIVVQLSALRDSHPTVKKLTKQKYSIECALRGESPRKTLDFVKKQIEFIRPEINELQTRKRELRQQMKLGQVEKSRGEKEIKEIQEKITNMKENIKTLKTARSVAKI